MKIRTILFKTLFKQHYQTPSLINLIKANDEKKLSRGAHMILIPSFGNSSVWKCMKLADNGVGWLVRLGWTQLEYI